MKNQLKLFLILFLPFGFIGCNTSEKEKKLPNIIIILADDLGYGDVSAFNPNSGIPTPQIDLLAENGMMFTNAHSPGNWCTPSRYGLLTGEYPFRINQKERRNRSQIRDDQLTVGRVLQNRGYSTACIGKWHLGFDSVSNPDYSRRIVNGPIDRGFDYFYGIYASLDIPPYYYIENDSVVVAPTESIADNFSAGWTKVQGAFWRGGKIAPGFKHDEVLDRFKEKALDYIDKKSSEDDPFFLYFPLPAPHTPWLPSKEFDGKSGAGMYGDFTVMVDQLVGDITNKIKEKGIEENTIVIFSSDNGPVWFEQDINKYGHDATGKFRGMKADLWEGAHHVPMIVKWPGMVEKGSMTSETVSFTDFLSTFAAMTNFPLENIQKPDSYDFTPILMGKKEEYKREYTVIMNNVLLYDDWKLIKGRPMGWLNRQFSLHEGRLPNYTDSIGLYNVANDPSEKENLKDAEREKLTFMIHALDSITGF